MSDKQRIFREILKTGIALSGILCYLHAQNPPVFYRDLKPDNVMITERGEIYLVDFGAAGTEETGVEVRYGTRGYAAPEQYDGKCAFDTLEKILDLQGFFSP